MDQKKARAYSYIRFSTPEQALGNSEDRQLGTAERYAEEAGLELDSSLRDKGVSSFRGKNRKKGALARFLHLLRKGEIPRGSYLLIENLDRLSRENPLDSFGMVREIVLGGVGIVTMGSNVQVYTEERLRNDPMAMMGLTFELGRGSGESARKSELLSKTWINKRAKIGERKLTGICPGWLQLDADKKTWLPIPERVEIVREIFALTIAGLGKRAVATELDARGVKPWGLGKKQAKGWHPSYIQKILTNPAVLGEYQPQKMATRTEQVAAKEWEPAHDEQVRYRVPVGPPIPDYFPAIISQEVWAEAAAKRKGPTNSPRADKVSNLFTGIVYDAELGSRMVFTDKGDLRGPGQYLETSSTPKPTRKITWPYRDFEVCMLGTLCDIAAPALAPSEAPTAASLAAKVADLEVKKTTLETQMARVTAAIEVGGDLAYLVDRIRQHQAALATINAQLEPALRELEEAQKGAVSTTRDWPEFQRLLGEALDPTNTEVRLKVRAELRARIKSIAVVIVPKAVKLAPWKRHGVFVISFANGAARAVEVQHHKRGQAPDVRVLDAPPPTPTPTPTPS